MPRDRDAHRLGALLAAAALVWPVVASAEVATDGTLGRWVRLTGPDVEVGADLGRVRGRNLFHSFRRFGVEAGGRVTFTGPGGLDNVVSRVTGGEASRIDGTLASRVGRADVWLVNPSGIVFGPGARLDVPGSFHASTADEVRFEDGAAFSAIEPEGSTLSVARPEAFGFLGGKPGAITVDRGVLEVSEGEALSLVGGDIRILGDLIGDPRVLPEEERRNGVLRAPEGTITLAALATLGDVLIDGLDERVSGTATVRMSDHALLSASGNGGGVIRVYSGRLLLEDRSAIVSNNLAMRDALGGIDIRADEIELLRGGEISSDTSGEGTGGAINIAAKRLLIDANGAESLNQPLDIGDPDTPFIVRIFFGNSLIRTSSGRLDLDGSAGDAGSITIKAEKVEIRDGGFISSSTHATGDAGDVVIEVERLSVKGSMGLIPSISSSAVAPFRPLNLRRSSDAGDIIIRSNTIDLINSVVTVTSGSDSDAGSVLLNARTIFIERSRVTSEALAGGNGAGQIGLSAHDTILIKDAELVSDGITAEQGSSIITLRAPIIALLGSSRVTSLNDGNVPFPDSGEARLLGNLTFISGDSEVLGSSTVELRGVDNQVGSGLQLAAGAFLDAGGLLGQGCVARRAGAMSTFARAGRQGGLPLSPDRPLASRAGADEPEVVLRAGDVLRVASAGCEAAAGG